MSQKVLIADAWPYVNGDLHPGHFSGHLISADICARFNRLIGNDVLMVSGSDCHGTPITVQADKEGIKPAQIVKKYHQNILELFKLFNLSFNLYTLTTTDNHRKIVQEIFLELLKNGFIQKGVSKQYYSKFDNKFLPDRYVEGTCPHCKSANQRSDQCEVCGRWLKDGELIDPKSKISGKPVELKDSEHYFLHLDKVGEELKEYVESKKGIWKEWVYKEAKGWLDEGLKPRAITRDMDWSIDLPVDEIKKLPKEMWLDNFFGKKIYVWFEAVIGYLSASIEWSQRETGDSLVIFNNNSSLSRDWKEWWLNPSSKHYYFMGQDNLVFHTIMWPAQLIGTQRNYVLPYNVVVNKFMNYEGKKFSKSKNWIIDSKALAEKYGVDTVRFYLALTLPENKEGNFSWNEFKLSVNSNLVGNIGNFWHRNLSFLFNKLGGSIDLSDYNIDLEVKRQIEQTFIKVKKCLEECQFVNALNTIIVLSAFGNKYFDENKIWQLVKENPQKAKEVMLNLLNIVLNLALLLAPFIPESAEKLFKIMGVAFPTPAVGKDNIVPVTLSSFKLALEPKPLFAKIEEAGVN